MPRKLKEQPTPHQRDIVAPVGLADLCRSFFHELAAITGLKFYFLPDVLEKQNVSLPDEVRLGCPLLGKTGYSCAACSETFHALLKELESKPDIDCVDGTCCAGLSVAVLRLPSGTSQDVLLVGQILPKLRN